MSSYTIDTLSNNIKLITRKNISTPRVALNLFMTSGIIFEKKAGIANLTGRLLLQGTESRSSEELANELDNNAIEISVDARHDYLRLRALCLNEDFDKTIELLEDILKNSTFDQLEKEVRKFEGELKLDLDSPKTQASDNLIKAIYGDHPYGHSHTKILEDLDKITKEDVIDFYKNQCFVIDRMSFTVVGDIERDKVYSELNKRFGSLSQTSVPFSTAPIPEISENKTVKIERKDAAQAQIIQGWKAPNISDSDYAPLCLLNTILGASGLSSRLFVELRDKKGLAYAVRSGYESLKHTGLFTVYIGTAPGNIKECLEGFDTEISKLKNEIISEKELADVKTNFLGKRDFVHETNSQQAYYLGLYGALGLGPAFDEEVKENIKKVKAEDIQFVAKKYFDQNSVISLLAPKEFLESV